jgi:hypothetical protein
LGCKYFRWAPIEDDATCAHDNHAFERLGDELHVVAYRDDGSPRRRDSLHD